MDIGPKTLEKLTEKGYVHDTVGEYGERGYNLSAGSKGVILGSMWCEDHKCYRGGFDFVNGRRELHAMDAHWPRLEAKLSEQFDFEWYDEWTVVYEEDKCYRTTADSYSWQPTAVWNEDTEDYLTPDSDPSEWIEWATDSTDRCLVREYPTDEQLTDNGWTEYECGYENGWHPGQTADPKEITRIVKAEMGDDVELVFRLSRVQQFDVSFCLWTRQGSRITGQFVSEYPEDGEWEYEMTGEESEDGSEVKISKVGGGTFGEVYDGSWHYHYVSADGEIVKRGTDYVTRFAVDHANVAIQVAEFFAE